MNSPHTDSLGFLIHDVARLMRKRFEARAASYGLSSAQWRLLAACRRTRACRRRGWPRCSRSSRSAYRACSTAWRKAAGSSAGRTPPTGACAWCLPPTKSLEAYGAIKSMAGEVYDEALAGAVGRGRAPPLIAGLEGDRRQSRGRRAVRSLQDQGNCRMNAVSKIERMKPRPRPCRLPQAAGPRACIAAKAGPAAAMQAADARRARRGCKAGCRGQQPRPSRRRRRRSAASAASR